MRITDPCENCKKRKGLCIFFACSDLERYFDYNDALWLKQPEWVWRR